VDLLGPKNGINLTYTTPDRFVPESIQLYRNSARQMQVGTNDFSVSESGGPGTGFDTVVLSAYPPNPRENLFADYVLK
jgi:hypothetical protein